MAEPTGGDGPTVVVHSRDEVAFSKGPSKFSGAPLTTHSGASRHVGDTLETSDGAAKDYIEIIVYFPDKKGVQVKIRDGQNIEAGDLFEVVKDEMKLPDAVREIFSLWLVSDFLELQLKPTHVPFKLVCYWEELLEKYTTISEEFRQRDEPVIMFKRNVFYSREEEKKISNGTQLRYLYWEAKQNILDGRYPLNQKECDDQAAIQAMIVDREDNENAGPGEIFGSTTYFKSHLAEYLPLHFCRRHWIYKTRENPERRLANAYSQTREAHQNASLNDLYLLYLKNCQEQPYYGSAFFRGQAEHPVKGIVSKVLSTKDDPVFVAINVDGVYIIDMDDFALLIGFHYEKLSWQFVESTQYQTNPNSLPALFLQFPSEDKEDETKLLQIFSREAILMDNLIEACINLKNQTESKKSEAESKVFHGKGSLAETFSRLALMTFNKEGKTTKCTMRTPRQTHDATVTSPVASA